MSDEGLFQIGKIESPDGVPGQINFQIRGLPERLIRIETFPLNWALNIGQSTSVLI